MDETKRKRVTYYQILGIEENSCEKTIKEAYFKASKSCHPDSNPDDKGLHEKFVLIQEAYTTLSKAEGRREYDHRLAYSRKINQSRAAGYKINQVSNDPGSEGYYHTPWRKDETLWSMRDTSKDAPTNAKSYYGFKGLKRVSNATVALVTGGILIVGGTLLHFFAVKHSRDYHIAQLDLKDQKLGKSYQELREKVYATDDAGRMELLKMRLRQTEHGAVLLDDMENEK